MPFLTRLVLAGLVSGTFLAGVGTLAGFLARWHWRLELFSHFRMQYLGGLVVLALLFGALKRFHWATAAGLLALINLTLIAPLYLPAHPFQNPPETPTYRVFLMNVLTRNPEKEAVLRLIEAADPDFIVLVEVDQKWLDALPLEARGYRFWVAHPRDDNFGLALFSRFPLEGSEILDLGGNGLESVVGVATLEGHRVTFLGSHPPPPTSERSAAQRNRQLLALARYAAAQSGPLLLLGDFNLTSSSPYFSDILHQSGLGDSRKGFGVQATWPTFWPAWMNIPIDHVLVSPDIRVIHREVGGPAGSDHRPVVLDFVVTGD